MTYWKVKQDLALYDACVKFKSSLVKIKPTHKTSLRVCTYHLVVCLTHYSTCANVMNAYMFCKSKICTSVLRWAKIQYTICLTKILENMLRFCLTRIGLRKRLTRCCHPKPRPPSPSVLGDI